jgi:hypothetical protein
MFQGATPDELKFHREEDRLKARRDQASVAHAARFAREEGREEGLEEGLEKGEVVGRIQTLQEVLRQPTTPREELLRLTVEELATRAEQLGKLLGQGLGFARVNLVACSLVLPPASPPRQPATWSTPPSCRAWKGLNSGWG